MPVYIGRMDIDQIRRENARRLAARFDTQRQFAELIDRAPAQVNHMIGKKPSKNIGKQMARHIEKCFDLPPYWLDTEHVLPNDGATDRIGSKPSFKMLPVISSVQAGEWGDAIDPYEPGDANEWAAVTGEYSDSAFVLAVEGDSMTSTRGGLSIPNGSQVIVEPEQQAVNGDIVVAKLEDVAQVTIKKLVIDPPFKYLMPLNEQYDKIEINGHCRIVGVVKRYFMDVR